MYLEIDDPILNFAIQNTYTCPVMALHLKLMHHNIVRLNKKGIIYFTTYLCHLPVTKRHNNVPFHDNVNEKRDFERIND